MASGLAIQDKEKYGHVEYIQNFFFLNTSNPGLVDSTDEESENRKG